MLIRRDPAPPLAGRVTSYYGFEVETPEPVRQREGPGTDVVVILTFEDHWLIDGALAPRLADAHPSREVAWAWRRLRATHGRVPVGTLAAELGWSRKRIVARFRDEIGLPPKAVARLVRFERARELAGTMPWGE